MPDDLLTESPADIALTEAIRTESTPPPEAPPAPEPEAPAPEAAAPVAEPPKAPEQRMVPQQALHEARQEARELKARLAALEAASPKEPELDETTDPIGTIGKLKQEINAFKKWQADQAEEASLGQQIGARINAYAKENPDYPAHYQFLQNSRVNELRALGHNDQAIAQQIRLEEMQLGRTALQNDLDPGEIISKLAIARGWQKAAAPTPLAPTPAAPAPQPAPAPTREAEERIERLERGQRAASSSSRSGGRGTAADDVAIENGVNLEGAAFDAWASKFIANQKREERRS